MRRALAKVPPIIVDICACIIAGTIYGLAYNLFYRDNEIAPGGATGLASVVVNFIKWPAGVFILIFNLPMFAFELKKRGWKYVSRLLIAVVSLSVLVDVFSFLPSATNDKLLAAAMGGSLGGLGLSIYFLRGINSGGSDLAASILNRYFPSVSVGRFILYIDIIVVAVATLAYGHIETALYSFVLIFVSTKTIDTVNDGSSSARILNIVTACPKEISAVILQFNRGATDIGARGCYTGEDKHMIVCVVKRWELPALKRLVKQADSRAFVFITNATEVAGEGFAPVLADDADVN